PPRRIREQRVDEERRPERAGGNTDRPDVGVVREVEGVEEPGEPDADEQQAGPVLGPARARDEPGRDERPAHQEFEHDDRRRLLLVVARRGERNGDAGDEQRRRNDDEPEPRGRSHSISAAIASAEISALGTKPRAPDSSISEPKSRASRLEVST